jgi:hypothetical protein
VNDLLCSIRRKEISERYRARGCGERGYGDRFAVGLDVSVLAVHRFAMHDDGSGFDVYHPVFGDGRLRVEACFFILRK